MWGPAYTCSVSVWRVQFSFSMVEAFACSHMLLSGHSEIEWHTVVRPLSAWAATLDCRPSVICSTQLSSTACQCAATCPAYVCSVHQPHFRNSSERAGREAVNDQASVRCTCSTLGLAREVQTFLLQIDSRVKYILYCMVKYLITFIFKFYSY